jgi:hypothetical protein
MEIEQLKIAVPTYPEILRQTAGDEESIRESFASLVRIERNDKWHIILCRSDYMTKGNLPSEKGVENFLEKVYLIQHLFVIETNEEKYLDSNQISEKDRLVKQYTL